MDRKETWKEKCQRHVVNLEGKIKVKQIELERAQVRQSDMQKLFNEVSQLYTKARLEVSTLNTELKGMQDSITYYKEEIEEMEKEEKENINN